jgi:hypothetical protein
VGCRISWGRSTRQSGSKTRPRAHLYAILRRLAGALFGDATAQPSVWTAVDVSLPMRREHAAKTPAVEAATTGGPQTPADRRGRLSLAIAGVGQLSIRDRLLSEHNYHALAGGMCSKPAVASSPLRLNRRVERAQRPARVHALGPGDGDGNMHCKCMSVRGCAVWTRPRGPRGRVGARIAGIANR